MTIQTDSTEEIERVYAENERLTAKVAKLETAIPDERKQREYTGENRSRLYP